MSRSQGPRVINRRLGAREDGIQPVVLRVLDILLSLFGLVLSAPLFPIVAFLIKLDSKGPVLYATERIGKDGKPFRMFKFRTMLDCAEAIDQSVCPQYDPRVTEIGRFLRKAKINEFPQLFNILRGDMSFVGPRPEAPDLAEMYPEDAKRVLLAKPGLVGPAVIAAYSGQASGRDEEELYPKGVDPKKFYIEHILPQKVKIDLYYLSRQTISGYLKIIYLALKETVQGAFDDRKTESQSKRGSWLMFVDLALGMISYTFGWLIFTRSTGLLTSLGSFLSGFLLVLVARPLLHSMLGLYNFVVELITPRDLYRLARAITLGTLLMLLFDRVLALTAYPLRVAIVDFILLTLMLTGVRLFLMRRYRHLGRLREEDRRPRALIFGANRNGLKALFALGGSKKSPYRILGFIDDADDKFGKTIHGIKVLGNRHHIQALTVLYNVREVILAPDAERRDDIDEVVAQCAKAGVRSRLFSPGREDEIPRPSSYPLRLVRLSDILPRVPVKLDAAALRSLLWGKTVLMFGSGGQLGSAICRNLFQSGCRKLVIVDLLENSLSEIMTELRVDLPGFQIIPAALKTLDIDTLNTLFLRHRPHVVVHAGMRKYLNLAGIDQDEVARSNYVRTFSLAKVASLHECEAFVLISSIKANARGNFVSNSLRLAEISLNAFFNRTRTNLVVARVGNIIENRGGIVSWLNDQIVEQHVLRMPGELAKTFLLSKNAAARAILQALVTGSTLSAGSSLLTSEPGALIGLQDVARRIANLYGLKLGEDVVLRFGEIPAGILDDEPAIKGAVDVFEIIPDLSWKDPMIESIFTGDPALRSGREWDQVTTQIISQFDKARLSVSSESVTN